LSHLLKCSKEELFLQYDKTLTKIQQAKLSKMLTDFKNGKPAAYILGYKYFYGLKFAVDKNVLIPRPESEWLVDQALDFITKSKRPLKVLDLGTGSGCLAIATAKSAYFYGVKVSASDISNQALVLAKQNAKANRVNIKFVKSDLFNNIPGRFDIILANLPYVPAKDYKRLYKNLKHEPKNALVDKNGDFYLFKKFLDELPKHLSKDGVAILEFDPKTKIFIESLHWKNYDFNFFADLNGLDRYCKVTL
jgi:release factor glutamine methyltransferase